MIPLSGTAEGGLSAMGSAGLGYFGDARRAAVGEELLERAVAGGTLVLRQLGGTRAGEMRYQRFLNSSFVDLEEIFETASRHTAEASAGRRVIAIQDTTEISFGRRREQPRDLGRGTDDDSPALFLHPVVAVERDGEQEVLGVVHGEIWTRGEERTKEKRKQRSFDSKESRRWLTAMETAAGRLGGADEIVMVADRESDIYTVFADRPKGMELVVRARHNRRLADGSGAFETAAQWRDLGRGSVSVAPRGPGDKGRTADVAIRAGSITVERPKHDCESRAGAIPLNLVHVEELDPPEGKQGLCWYLLTSLPVASLDQAREVAEIYRQRWRIEQVFRGMKRDGLGLEDSQLMRKQHLFKLTAIALLASVRTIQLVDARDGSPRPASDLLDEEMLPVADAIGRRLEGKTTRQQNPHPWGSRAWLAWIVARCGGWNCYYKPPGPKTMRTGWDKFAQQLKGYAQALDDLATHANP